MLISKENISLWTSFISLGLLIEYRKDLVLRKYLTLFALISITYFIIITSWVMPGLINGTPTQILNIPFLVQVCLMLLYICYNIL